MRSNFVRIPVFLVFPLLLLSCDRAPADYRTIQEQRSENVIVTLLSDTDELKQESNRLVLEFRDTSTNELTAVDNVQIRAMMPMPGMAPMFGDISPPTPTTAGRYEFSADFTMVGRWALVVTFDSGSRVQFNLSAY